MSVELLYHGGEAVLATPRAFAARALRGVVAAPSRWPLRVFMAVAAVAGCLAFVLGVGNRFTRGPLFIYIPEVDLIPPLGKAAWQQAFVIHQQNPLFALCGGYQVGGMESLTVYQMLYMWEWLRAGSVYVLAGCAVAFGLMTARTVTRAAARAELVPVLGLAGLGALYLVLRYFADHAGLFATINIGQHRHALDVTFASLALALLLAATLSEMLAEMRPHRRDGEARLVFAAGFAFFIALDIAFGALFEATDAAVVWSTFPGYVDGLLPGSDRLFAFSPAWRNVTENVYLIQACHRVLSIALWIAALGMLTAAWWRGSRLGGVALLFGLLTLDGAFGVATLLLDEPAVLSIAHQACAVLVLATASVPIARSMMGFARGSTHPASQTSHATC
jgi:heme a synthase